MGDDGSLVDRLRDCLIWHIGLCSVLCGRLRDCLCDMLSNRLCDRLCRLLCVYHTASWLVYRIGNELRWVYVISDILICVCGGRKMVLKYTRCVWLVWMGGAVNKSCKFLRFLCYGRFL